MQPSTLPAPLLVDEAQLGQRLNRDLRCGDRADFRLHLALLTEAIEAQPWFGRESAPAPAPQAWRAQSGLPPQAALQGEVADVGAGELNERLQQGGSMVDVRLWLALHSPALVGRQPALDPAIYDSLSALGPARWQSQQASNEPRFRPGGEDPSLMLSLLAALNEGVDARLQWLCQGGGMEDRQHR